MQTIEWWGPVWGKERPARAERRRPCYCGGSNFRELPIASRFMAPKGWSGAIVRCTNCGVVTRAPALFDDHSVAATVGDLQPPTTFAAGGENLRPHLRRRLEKARKLSPSLKLLEVGAGSGVFMRQARHEGWACEGIELDTSSAAQLANQDFVCHTTPIEQLSALHDAFGFIHMNHVLEHMIDPLVACRAAAKKLISGGVLVIEVPNEFEAVASYLKRYLGVLRTSHTSFTEHAWFFAPDTLSALVKSAGLRVLSVKTPLRVPPLNRSASLPLMALGAATRRGPVIELWATRA